MAPTADLSSGTPSRRRLRIRVEGIVQGVGFRPYLYQLARRLGLAGHVWNDPHGVEIEVEGAEAAVAEFLVRLPTEAPPLASIERIRTEDEDLAPVGEGGFSIMASESGEDQAGSTGPAALIPPDITTCDLCLRELFEPADRRYRYPFINCTHCGPRYTIVRALPFDRALTTMSGFTMCARCHAEYTDPADRRFHAQPNACPECGPRLRVVAGTGTGSGPETAAATALPGGMTDAIHAASAALRAGAIIALKGLGGFHLACLARDGAAVRRLRERKRRPAKPFALMVPDLATARRLVELDDVEEELLCSRERPIVLARRRDASSAGAGSDASDPVMRTVVTTHAPGSEGAATAGAAPTGRAGGDVAAKHCILDIADEVAPGHRELGVMLPYTPLHHLLLAEVGEALVMTSGNRSDEPIAFSDDDALGRLADIADLFLLHDRPIQLPVDDSVARVVTIAGERRVQLIRRSRGYVPLPLTLPLAATRPLLACGAELKNTFCLARGEHAWLSQHIGDLEDYETEQSFGDGITHLERLYGVRPELIAHDLHPDFRSTKYALTRAAGGRALAERPAPDHQAGGDRSDPPGDVVSTTLPVQHHHAHLAACLAEYGEDGPALGLIFDGTGYGPDGTIWGGEILLGDLVGYERVAYLLPIPMPGGIWLSGSRGGWRVPGSWQRGPELLISRHRYLPPWSEG